MASDEIIKKADEWAALAWDESDLPDEEKSDKSTNDLCKACGSLGWSRGYTQGRRDAWRWIPVSERLPEFGDRILALYSGSFLAALRCVEGRCDDYGRCEAIYTDESDDRADDEFTHWLPIKLPGGEND